MIKFVKYTSPKTKLTQHIVAAAGGYNVKGDWIIGVPTLFDVTNFLSHTIKECIGKTNKFKHHGDLKVVEEPGGVYIEIVSVMAKERTRLCGFVNEISDISTKPNTEMGTIISPKEMALQVLQKCTVEGNVVKLPAEQLDRTLYAEVKKLLELIGGKWTGGKVSGFVYEISGDDLKELLDAQANGDGRNLKKEFQFFPTPRTLAMQMAEKCSNWKNDLTGDVKVLEPSAGDGALVKAITDFYPKVKTVDCFELMDVNRIKLKKVAASKLIGNDFLKAVEADELNLIRGQYDVIIANPPFTNNQDIDHIYAMYRACKTNGRIVTIASMSWVTGSQKKQVEFREWLDKVEAWQEELPSGTFSESGTKVGAMLLVIDKLEAEPAIVTEPEKIPVGTRVKVLEGKYKNRVGNIQRYPFYAGGVYITFDRAGREKSPKTELVIASMGQDATLGDKHLLSILEVMAAAPEEETPPAVTEEAKPACRECGCHEMDACKHPEQGNCWWVEPDLCSHCQNWPGESTRYSVLLKDVESFGPPKGSFQGDPGPLAKKLMGKSEEKSFKNIQPMAKQTEATTKQGSGIIDIPLAKITGDPNQPRKFFNQHDLEELAQSIIAVGVIEPILVRPMHGGYMIVFGERRFRASLIAHEINPSVHDIPCMVKVLTDAEVLELQITENMQRSNPHPMEEAVSLQKAAVNHTVQDLALRYGKSEKFIANRLLLNNLIDDFQEMFFREIFNIKDAISLAKVSQDNQRQILSQVTSNTPNWKERDSLHVYNIGNYAARAENELSGAKFDIEDPKLNPDMGACTSCKFNSANNLTLYVNEDEGNICSNSTCFVIKKNRSYQQKVELELQNPETIFIATNYYGDSDKEKVELAKQVGAQVLEKGFRFLTQLEAKPTYESIKESFDVEEEFWDSDEEDQPTEAEIEHAVQEKLKEALEEWSEENEEIESANAEGRIKKAFVLVGGSAGEYKDIILSSASSVANGSASVAHQIEEIKNRETRAQELDGEKVWLAVKSLAEANSFEIFKSDAPLENNESKAVAMAMYDSIDYKQKEYFCAQVLKNADRLSGVELAQAIEKITTQQYNALQRLFIASKLFPGFSSHLKISTNYWGKKAAEVHLISEILQIEQDQLDKATKRQAGVNQRIAELKKSK